jgi:hypothetical protein
MTNIQRLGVLLVPVLMLLGLMLSWGLAEAPVPSSPWVPTPAPRQDLECWQHQGSWTITCSPRALECPHG